MTEEIRIKTRDWERMLSPVQQEKYKLAIKQGWFANYHDNAWRHTHSTELTSGSIRNLSRS